MSFAIVLTIDGKEYDRVLSVNYNIGRAIDHFGRPVGQPIGGQINLTIESSVDNSLFAWIVDPYAHKNGSIKFQQGGQASTMRELSWENGYIVSFAESADATSASSMVISFTISAEKLKMSGETQDNKWPKNS